jgi:hypothetical protein
MSGPRRVAIVQSSYVPWKGFFDLIAAVDEFILFDDVQYTRRDWRNRNGIKTPHGVRWITIPVNVKGRYHAAVKDMSVADRSWTDRHWRSILHAYRPAACFDEVGWWLQSLYEEAARLSRLSDINHLFIDAICRRLGIGTKLSWSMDYVLAADRNERLITLCQQVGATEYLSGPSAKAYLDEPRFRDAGVTVVYADYSGYREYRQLHGPFVHTVSVIDLLLNEGGGAASFLKGGGVAGAGNAP